jgi:hypothetical protein
MAVGIAPPDSQVGGGQDAPVEVGGAPVLACRGGEDQPERVGPGFLLGAGCLDPGAEQSGARHGEGDGDL